MINGLKVRPKVRTKNRGGAPKGNRNAQQHGGYSAAFVAETRARRAQIRAVVRESDRLGLLMGMMAHRREQMRMHAEVQALRAEPQ